MTYSKEDTVRHGRLICKMSRTLDCVPPVLAQSPYSPCHQRTCGLVVCLLRYSEPNSAGLFHFLEADELGQLRLWTRSTSFLRFAQEEAGSHHRETVSGLGMAKRPNSPAVRGFGGIGLSSRDGRRRDGMSGRSGKRGTWC